MAEMAEMAEPIKLAYFVFLKMKKFSMN